ncbi:hypothetical protein C8F01DRAFT_1101607 [Mycena amicta]|nr:hypothetical protein C8F01DRAFT_1101607 [Mycena amicta]
MRISTIFNLALMACALPPVVAWTYGQGAEVHFYADGKCSAFLSSVPAFYLQAPFVGVNGQGASCITLNPPGNAQSINTAAIWVDFFTTRQTTPSTPAETNGICTFFDGFNCDGRQVSSNFVPNNGVCRPARSSGGFLWKSAICKVL